MRWSRMHVPTLRSDPADADAASHRLLLRGGFIRQLMAGHYSLLPMAMRVRAKVIAIVREEMESIGVQEFLLPTMHPADVWKTTGRWDSLGELLFRFKDRKGAEAALGVTHEEVFATVAQDLTSYKQLPQLWYQFQTKYRDEARPKAGLMRTREFTMKDAYSFDLTQDGLDASFDAHAKAYERIFARLGIPALPVDASAGAMGGSGSTEFMCPSDAGEDDVVRCETCGYAGNIEKATSKLPAISDGDGPAKPQPFDTPGATCTDELAAQYDAPAERQIKTLVYMIEGALTLVLLRGDHTLVEQKLIDLNGGAAVRPANAAEIRAALGSGPEHIGAVGISDLRVLCDLALSERKNMFTGANRDGVHLSGVDVARDIRTDAWVDLRSAQAGEGCPACTQPLSVIRAMEVGHIFKLGTTYSEAMQAHVLNQDGKRVPLVMGSYGIGVERAISAIVECHHDDNGIRWPLAVAPFQVAVVVAQIDHEDTANAAEELYKSMGEAGIECIIDDRKERPGVKFRDVELIGIPLRITVGKRSIADQQVELTRRATGQTELVAVGDVLTVVQNELRNLRT